jgi:hypothetical protein
MLLFALLNTVNKIVEFQCFLVVDAHKLLGGALQNFLNSSERGLDFDVEVEFGPVVLSARAHFPNLEFGAIETSGNNKAGVGITLYTLTSKQVTRLLELNNCR